MGSISVQGDVLSVKTGFGKPELFDLKKLRINYLVTTQHMKWFVTVSKWDIIAVDLDDLELTEGIALFAEAFRTEKAGALSSVNICLADYEDNRIVISLAHFKKSGVDIFALLNETRAERMKSRENWLASSPSVRLSGAFKEALLDRDGFSLPPKKSIAWSDVATVQLDSQESLVKIFNLLVIPEGVSGGVFSLSKYKYSLRYIPKKLADLYLAECLYWMNLRKKTAAVGASEAGGQARTEQAEAALPAYAGFVRRLAAGVADFLILSLVGAVASLLLMAINPGLFRSRQFVILSMYPVIIAAWLYFAILESSALRGTPGKLLLGIAVTDRRGKRVGFGQASGRFFSKILTALTYGIGFLAVLWTKKKTALHDYTAGTLVLKRIERNSAE